MSEIDGIQYMKHGQLPVEAWQVSGKSYPPSWAVEAYNKFIAGGADLIDGDWMVLIGGEADFVKADRFAELYSAHER